METFIYDVEKLKMKHKVILASRGHSYDMPGTICVNMGV